MGQKPVRSGESPLLQDSLSCLGGEVWFAHVNQYNR